MSDGVVEHERMEEDFEEYINVMVCQEESIDVDVDRKSNQSFNIDASKSSFWKFLIWIGRTLFRQAQRLVLNVGICQMNVRNLRKHMVKSSYEFSLYIRKSYDETLPDGTKS